MSVAWFVGFLAECLVTLLALFTLLLHSLTTACLGSNPQNEIAQWVLESEHSAELRELKKRVNALNSQNAKLTQEKEEWIKKAREVEWVKMEGANVMEALFKKDEEAKRLAKELVEARETIREQAEWIEGREERGTVTS
jgi:hypothetical protein